MKALILNSGIGIRMGDLTSKRPKCMVQISDKETILSRQLKQITAAGIQEVVITTGPFGSTIPHYCESLGLPLSFTFVNNPKYADTNYIYSIYLAQKNLDDEIIMLHGDLVFEDEVLLQAVRSPSSCMIVSTAIPLPCKDFKAVIQNKSITAVGVEYFEQAVAAQPLYHLKYDDWRIWLKEIILFCQNGQVNCYAENALNRVLDHIVLRPLEVREMLCGEIDNPADLDAICAKLQAVGTG